MLSPENVPLENVFRMNKRGDGDYSLWTDIAAECSKQKKRGRRSLYGGLFARGYALIRR